MRTAAAPSSAPTTIPTMLKGRTMTRLRTMAVLWTVRYGLDWVLKLFFIHWKALLWLTLLAKSVFVFLFLNSSKLWFSFNSWVKVTDLVPFSQAGQVVAFNPAGDNTLWECIDDTGNCPGRLEYVCGDEPLQLVDEECDCPLQWLVRHVKNISKKARCLLLFFHPRCQETASHSGVVATATVSALVHCCAVKPFSHLFPLTFEFSLRPWGDLWRGSAGRSWRGFLDHLPGWGPSHMHHGKWRPGGVQDRMRRSSNYTTNKFKLKQYQILFKNLQKTQFLAVFFQILGKVKLWELGSWIQNQNEIMKPKFGWKKKIILRILSEVNIWS